MILGGAATMKVLGRGATMKILGRGAARSSFGRENLDFWGDEGNRLGLFRFDMKRHRFCTFLHRYR